MVVAALCESCSTVDDEEAAAWDEGVFVLLVLRCRSSDDTVSSTPSCCVGWAVRSVLGGAVCPRALLSPFPAWLFSDSSVRCCSFSAALGANSLCSVCSCCASLSKASTVPVRRPSRLFSFPRMRAFLFSRASLRFSAALNAVEEEEDKDEEDMACSLAPLAGFAAPRMTWHCNTTKCSAHNYCSKPNKTKLLLPASCFLLPASCFLLPAASCCLLDSVWGEMEMEMKAANTDTAVVTADNLPTQTALDGKKSENVGLLHPSQNTRTTRSQLNNQPMHCRAQVSCSLSSRTTLMWPPSPAASFEGN